jgi:hypothetical protein
MGLGLAATYVQQQIRHGVELPSEELSEVLRTRKALAFCHACVRHTRTVLQHLLTICRWLQATLGYVSPMPRESDSAQKEVILPSTQAKEQVLTTDKTDHSPFARDHDRFRDAVAAIANLKAKVMRTLSVCSNAADLLVTIQGLQWELLDWYGQLPHEAHLVQLGGDAEFPMKTPIYSLHLLHLGAVMLIFRHCLAGLRTPGDRGTLSLQQKDLMNKALSDGLLAAKQSARVVDIIGQASKSPPHCWLTM